MVLHRSECFCLFVILSTNLMNHWSNFKKHQNDCKLVKFLNTDVKFNGEVAESNSHYILRGFPLMISHEMVHTFIYEVGPKHLQYNSSHKITLN